MEKIESNVRQLKLIDGTELFGITSYNEDGSVNIRNPMYLSPEEQGIVLLDYMPLSADNECVIPHYQVITVTRVQTDMIKYYNNSVIMAFDGTKKIIDAVKEANDRIRQGMIVEDMESTSIH